MSVWPVDRAVLEPHTIDSSHRPLISVSLPLTGRVRVYVCARDRRTLNRCSYKSIHVCAFALAFVCEWLEYHIAIHILNLFMHIQTECCFTVTFCVFEISQTVCVHWLNRRTQADSSRLAVHRKSRAHSFLLAVLNHTLCVVCAFFYYFSSCRSFRRVFVNLVL